ncbi:MAG: PAS domain-containing protein [Woeseiaceae bacterium]|nr:PAS domain-containing protein [Woeseiaceae bacterium]
MAGYSILYLGRREFADRFLRNLEHSPLCRRLRHNDTLQIPESAADDVDLVLYEAGPASTSSGNSIRASLRALGEYPLVALTSREQEHRGVAAVRNGAQSYLCIDDVDEARQHATFDHAVQRHRLLRRLSEADDTVLSILKSINDGVIVVDRHGNVLDINPAARSILSLPPRVTPDSDSGRVVLPARRRRQDDMSARRRNRCTAHARARSSRTSSPCTVRPATATRC